MQITCQSKSLFTLLKLVKLAKKDRASLTFMGKDWNLRVSLTFPDHQYTLHIPYTGDPQVAFTIAYESISEILTVKGETLSFEVLDDSVEVKGDNGFVIVEGSKVDYCEDRGFPPPFMTVSAERLYNLLPAVFLNKSLISDPMYVCSRVEIADETFNWVNTDGVRLAQIHRPLYSVVASPHNITEEAFVIKDSVLSALKHLKLTGHIYFGKRDDVIFIWNNEWLIQARDTFRFPDWKAVIPQDRTETARVSTKQLLQALKDIKVSSVILYGKDKELHVHGEERNRRQFKTVQTFIPMKPILPKEGLEFQTALLIDLLQCNPSPMTHLFFGMPLLLKSSNNDWMALLMGIKR